MEVLFRSPAPLIRDIGGRTRRSVLEPRHTRSHGPVPSLATGGNGSDRCPAQDMSRDKQGAVPGRNLGDIDSARMRQVAAHGHGSEATTGNVDRRTDVGMDRHGATPTSMAANASLDSLVGAVGGAPPLVPTPVPLVDQSVGPKAPTGGRDVDSRAAIADQVSRQHQRREEEERVKMADEIAMLRQLVRDMDAHMKATQRAVAVTAPTPAVPLQRQVTQEISYADVNGLQRPPQVAAVNSLPRATGARPELGLQPPGPQWGLPFQQQLGGGQPPPVLGQPAVQPQAPPLAANQPNGEWQAGLVAAGPLFGPYYRVVSKAIKSYSGKIPVRTWVANFQRSTQGLHEVEKMNLFEKALQDSVASWFMDQQMADSIAGVAHTTDSWLTRLIAQYDRSSKARLTELENCHMRQGEDVTEFLRRVQHAIFNYNPQMPRAECVNWVTRLIDVDLRATFMTCGKEDSSWSDIQVAAQTAQAVAQSRPIGAQSSTTLMADTQAAPHAELVQWMEDLQRQIKRLSLAADSKRRLDIERRRSSDRDGDRSRLRESSKQGRTRDERRQRSPDKSREPRGRSPTQATARKITGRW